MTERLSLWRRMRGSPEVASCQRVTRTLQAYLDGELDAAEAPRIARHLELCRRCGLEASVYAELKSAVARRATPPADPAAVERLRRFGLQLVNQGTQSR